MEVSTIMARQQRELKPGFCYHITVRCNNREFRLVRLECREVLLYAIQRCQEKYGFKLYGLCIMSNHVHYLLEPVQPDDLPKIMHWLNWYTAMCFNRMLNFEKESDAEPDGAFLGNLDKTVSKPPF
jgi:putative transposase